MNSLFHLIIAIIDVFVLKNNLTYHNKKNKIQNIVDLVILVHFIDLLHHFKIKF